MCAKNHSGQMIGYAIIVIWSGDTETPCIQIVIWITKIHTAYPVFHNLSGCEAHIVIYYKEIVPAYEERVDLLLIKEKYISFIKHVDSIKLDKKNYVKLRFIDSFRFLASSLDKLASFLSKDKLRIL